MKYFRFWYKKSLQKNLPSNLKKCVSTEPEYIKHFVIFSSIKPIMEKLKLNTNVKLFYSTPLPPNTDTW